MKEEENNREITGVVYNDVDDSENAIQAYNLKYKIICPLHIYLCLKIDFFGAKMYDVPYF